MIEQRTWASTPDCSSLMGADGSASCPLGQSTPPIFIDCSSVENRPDAAFSEKLDLSDTATISASRAAVGMCDSIEVPLFATVGPHTDTAPFIVPALIDPELFDQLPGSERWARSKALVIDGVETRRRGDEDEDDDLPEVDSAVLIDIASQTPAIAELPGAPSEPESPVLTEYPAPPQASGLIAEQLAFIPDSPMLEMIAKALEPLPLESSPAAQAIVAEPPPLLIPKTEDVPTLDMIVERSNIDVVEALRRASAREPTRWIRTPKPLTEGRTDSQDLPSRGISLPNLSVRTPRPRLHEGTVVDRPYARPRLESGISVRGLSADEAQARKSTTQFPKSQASISTQPISPIPITPIGLGTLYPQLGLESHTPLPVAVPQPGPATAQAPSQKTRAKAPQAPPRKSTPVRRSRAAIEINTPRTKKKRVTRLPRASVLTQVAMILGTASVVLVLLVLGLFRLEVMLGTAAPAWLEPVGLLMIGAGVALWVREKIEISW